MEVHFGFPSYRYVDENLLIRQTRNPITAIAEIAKVEAPVSEEWVLKRVVPLYGREKVTNVVRDSYSSQKWALESYGLITRNGFIYKKDAKMFPFRVPSAGTKREIKYIAIEELATGMLTFIQQNHTVEKEGLFLTVAKTLGFQRTGEAIAERMEEALYLLRNLVEVNGEKISLK